MKTLSLIQGSESWHQHRATSRNASDAPAMLGISPYKTRNQLLHERATGIVPEVDEPTQRRFDGGHRYEALARPLAEKIIGEELSPVTGVEGKDSASFDGITFDETKWWEHKWLNKELQSILSNVPEVNGSDLPEHYRVQLEQQAKVSSGERGLFMASKWDANDQLLEELHCWYTPDLKLRERIEAGWEQFEKDLEEYKRKLAAGDVATNEVPVAEVIMALPAISIQATGMVTYSNLPEFKKAAETYIANINTNLVTDQHFADAEATVRFCKKTEEALEVQKKAVLAQTATIDEVIRTIEYIQEQLSTKRLDLDKKVKIEKEKRKAEIAQKARMLFNDYVLALEEETKPIRITMPMPIFADAMKGLKKLSAMEAAVDTALRDGKYAADQAAKDVRAKLAWCKENAAGMSMLFPDLQQIISMETEAFQATIKNRIAEYRATEENKAQFQTAVVATPEYKAAQDALNQTAANILHKIGTDRPTDAQIVEALAKSFGVSPDTARSWLENFGKEEAHHAQGSQEDEAEAVELRRKAVQLAAAAVEAQQRKESYRRLNPHTTFKKEHPEG